MRRSWRYRDSRRRPLGMHDAILREVAAQLRDVATNVATPAATSQVGELNHGSGDSGGIGPANGSPWRRKCDARRCNRAAWRGTGSAPTRSRQTDAVDATSQDGGITAGSVASTVLKSGFGLAPLIGGLVGLFVAGGDGTPAPLVKYAMPRGDRFSGSAYQRHE